MNLFTTTVKLLSSNPTSFHTLILTSIPSPNLLGIPQISPVISFTSIPSRTTLQLIPNPAASPSTLRITLNHFPPITLYEDFGYSNRHKPIPTQIEITTSTHPTSFLPFTLTTIISVEFTPDQSHLNIYSITDHKQQYHQSQNTRYNHHQIQD